MLNIGELNLKVNTDTSSLDGLGNKAKSAFSTIGGVAVKGFTAAATAATTAVTAVGAGVVKITTEATNSFAEYEQLVGGIEAVYGKAMSTKIMDKASEAWKTAGMSASQYGQIAMQAGATMIAMGVEGDALTEAIDTQVSAVADLSAAFGTDLDTAMGIVSQASTGLYSNLGKLVPGYDNVAGAERLAAEAGEHFNQTLDPANPADFAKMLQYYTEKVGIAGKAQEEAASTISGSMNAMKAAYANLITGLADENANVPQLVDNLVESAGNALDNLLPVVERALESISQALPKLINGISEKLPGLIEKVGPQLGKSIEAIIRGISKSIPALLDTLIKDILPTIVDSGKSLVEGLGEGILNSAGDIADAAIGLVTDFVGYIADNTDVILEGALDIIMCLVNGLINNVDKLVDAAISIVLGIVDFIADNADVLAEAAVQLVVALVVGIVKALPKIIEAAVKIGLMFLETLFGSIPKLFDLGARFLVELVKGLASKINEVAPAIEDFVKHLIDGFKKKIGQIKDIGKSIVSGILDGIKGAWNSITSWVTSKIDAIKESVKRIIPGHRTGLSYVPYDGYIAELHKGERVLTQSEADRYEKGESSAPGNTVNNVYNINVPNNDNAYETAINLRNLIRREELGYV